MRFQEEFLQLFQDRNCVLLFSEHLKQHSVTELPGDGSALYLH